MGSVNRNNDRVIQHYNRWFKADVLYRIYDLKTESFVYSTSPENSIVMNRDLLSRTIADSITANGKIAAKSWIVIIDKDTIDFSNPVFIGSEDL